MSKNNNDVKVASSLSATIGGWSKDEQMIFDGGLVRPLRSDGFDVVHSAFLIPTTALSVEWIEPVEDMSYRWAKVALDLVHRSVYLRVDAYDDGSIWLSGV